MQVDVLLGASVIAKLDWVAMYNRAEWVNIAILAFKNLGRNVLRLVQVQFIEKCLFVLCLPLKHWGFIAGSQPRGNRGSMIVQKFPPTLCSSFVIKMLLEGAPTGISHFK